MTETERSTEYGRLIIGSQPELFAQAVSLAAAQRAATIGSREFCWALSGGATPQAWYRWCVESRAISQPLLKGTHFTVSDERHVPLDSPQSNFGNADRLLLSPLNVPSAQKHPWMIDGPAPRSAEEYEQSMRQLLGPGRGYDVCMLGVGDDAHTASFFPGSPLLTEDGDRLFEAVLIADTAWRLTITPLGLRACGRIVVMAFGAHKAAALKRVFMGPYDPLTTPAQILKTCSDRVTWLVDDEAAAEL